MARTPQEEEASDRLGTFVSRAFADPLAGLLLRAVDGLGDDARDFLRLAAVVASAPIPFHLVAAVMGSLRAVDRGESRRLAEAAIDEADRFALTEEPAGDRSVHPLVSRVIRWTHATDDLDRVRHAAVAALLERLPAQYDPGAYAELEIELVHARVLAGDASADPEAVLIGRVARYDLVRGSYDSGERLFTMQLERLLERRNQTDRDVIDAMSNLAGARFVVGDVDGTIDLYRRVLELREETEGPEADAVRVARGNLASTLTLAGEYGAARDVLTTMLDRNREALGPQHAETTNAAWELYQTLCELGERRTAHEILSRDLSWLLSRMPVTLGADQRRVRRSVAELPEFE